MPEQSSSSSEQNLNLQDVKAENPSIAQAGRDVFQYNGVITFNETRILQISVEEIKSRELIECSPYKGLNKFEPEDKDLFFGREQFLTGLVDEVEKSNLVLLLGASGSGKSSVVRAGLIPWMYQKWGSRFVKLMLTPDRNPFESLYACLLSKYKQTEAQIAKEAKADTLSLVVKQLKQPDDYWLIFIDQFEELFTSSLPNERDLFIASLLQLNKTNQNSIKIVATMRADFLDKLSPYAQLIKATNKHRPMIAEMQPDELRLAIEQPAAHHGVVFEAGLVDKIINDIQGQKGYLPLLQYTLNLLWETEVRNGSIDDRTLNKSTYHQLGGVQGALQKRVDSIYEALSVEEKLATTRIFLQLVDIGEDVASGSEWKPVRKRASKSVFSNKLEERVLLKLIDESLLVSDRTSEAEESTIEITHEILLSSWTTLNTWIKDNRLAIALRNRLNHDMNLWKPKKSDDELWSGAKLERVLELRKDQTFNEVLGGFCEEENQFIDLSLGRRERQQRRSIIGLTVFSAIALLLAALAGWQWRLAAARKIDAEISKNQVIGFYSESLFNAGRKFDSLLEILPTAIRVHYSNLAPPIPIWGALIKAVNAEKEYKRLDVDQYWVNSIAFSPDRKTLASGTADKTIKIWDVATGKPIKTLTGHQNSVFSIAFSPDGTTLASGSVDRTIKLWDVATGKAIKTFTGHQESVRSIALSPDGKTLASGSFDKTIRLWDVATGKQIKAFTGHQKKVRSIVFVPDGKTLASSSFDKTIRLWDVATGKQIKAFTGHQSEIGGIAISTDGKTLASSSKDKTIKLWDVATGKPIKTFTGHEDTVSSVVFSRDGKTLASGSKDQTIRLWDVATGKPIKTMTGHQNWVISIALSPDGKTLASGSYDKTIRLWDMGTNKAIKTLTKHQGWVMSTAFSPDRQTLASGGEDKIIRLWDVATGKQIITLTGHLNRVNNIAFSYDGKTLASGSEDKSIRLWDVATGKQIKALTGHQGAVNNIAFSPDGKSLASGSMDKTIKLWDVATRKTIITLAGHEDSVESIAFSPDGKTLASGSNDQNIKLWNVANGKQIITLTGHRDWMSSLVFSPDRKTLASSSGDNAIKLWDVATGKQIITLLGHSETVRSIAFSPDGKTLASGSNDKTIKLWDVATRKEIITLNEHSETVMSVVFSPDGKTLASGSMDKTIILWNLDFDDLVKRGCNWVHDYLHNSPNVKDSDRKLCDDIVSIPRQK